MADHLGSYNAATSRTTVRFAFSTHAATGAPVAPSSAFEAADLIIYKDGSATQRTSSSGVTMTSPFDSITGLHVVAIDLTDNTDAGFWAAGSWYMIVLSPDETVDSLAALKVLAYFEIGPPQVNVTQISGDATAADNAESFFDGTGYEGTNNVIPTVTTLTNLPAITSNWLTAAGLATDAVAEIQSGLATASALSDVHTDLTTLTLSTASLTTAVGVIDDFLDTEVAAIKAKTDLIPDIAISGTVSGTPTTTSIVGAAGVLSSTNDIYNGAFLIFTSGTAKGLGMEITDYVGSTRTFTTDAFSVAAADTDTFIIAGRVDA